MTTHTKRLRGSGLTAALAILAWAGCSKGDPLSNEDNTPPSVSVLQPTNEAIIETSRPAFVIDLSDNESGIFVSTISATLDGLNVSQAFINGFNAARSEIRVVGTLELEDGLHMLEFRVADNAGNSSRTTLVFTTLSGTPGD